MRASYLLTIVLINALAQVSLAQTNVSLYSANYTGICSIEDVASDLQGGNVYSGSTYTASFYELFVMRVNSNGQVLWTMRYPDTLSIQSSSIVTDTSGIYLVGTQTDTATGSTSGFAARIDYSGSVIWRNKITAPLLTCITIASPGKYITAGQNCIVEFDENGTLLWSHSDSLSAPILSYRDLTCDSYGNIYVSGARHGSSSTTVGIITKYDSLGNVIWYKEYHGNFMPFGWYGTVWNSTELLGYGWFMVPAGINGVFFPIYITQMDTAGIIHQSFCSPVSNTNPESFSTSDAVMIDTNTLLLAGRRSSTPMLFTFELNSFSMTKAVSMQFASGEIRSVVLDNDSTFSYCGSRQSQFNGIFHFGHMDTSMTHACGWLPFTTGTSGLNATLSVTSHVHGIAPFAINQTLSATSTSFIIDTCIFTEVNENSIVPLACRIFPNPSSDKCIVTFATAATRPTYLFLRNISGEVVREITLPARQQAIELNVSDLCPGIYLLTSENGIAEKIEVVND